MGSEGRSEKVAMAHLLSDLAHYFKLDETNIDNWTFKLFYKGSSVICMLGATVGIATQYFGDPISCEFQGINSDLAQDYCWIHGTSYIPPQYQPHMKCILENGLIASFGTDGKTTVMIAEEQKYDDGVVIEAVVERYTKYFKSIFHHNNWYFGYFIFCEFLNFFLMIIQFWLIDAFLNNKFRWFGLEVVEYYSWSFRDRQNRDLMLRNPLCAVFPTEVSCNIPNVGAAGNEQAHNGLCVLTQNIINEKIYLFLWFWFMFLFTVSIFFVFYRICPLFFEKLRFQLLFKTVRHKYDEDIRKCLEYVLSKCQIGDWFVLYQLSKNCNPYFLREFIKELARELKSRPKKSKSTISTSGSLKKIKASDLPDVEMGDMLYDNNEDSEGSEDSESEASSKVLLQEKDAKSQMVPRKQKSRAKRRR